ncbi:hypothetical protein GDO78_022729 [Eleutherodactylus coqui]|uniref:Uncharacterized protein n=1 Tax=Eleutherodactylus coqui TaxID=57060 RepID=A0A8J6E4U0_ELECQ|nr:hypothetical protein GDO78_022729 [Eleutherodactylus coqui]
MLTGEDGSRRFGYCRRLLPSGKGPRLPEVYCVISRLGCFDLFSKVRGGCRSDGDRAKQITCGVENGATAAL